MHKILEGISLSIKTYQCNKIKQYSYFLEARRGSDAQVLTVKVTGCGFDPHSLKLNVYLNFYFNFALMLRQSAALKSITQHVRLPEFG